MSRIHVARAHGRGGASRRVTWTRLAALPRWFQRILAGVLGGAGDAFAVLVAVGTSAKDAFKDLPQNRVPHVSMGVGPAIVQTRWGRGEHVWAPCCRHRLARIKLGFTSLVFPLQQDLHGGLRGPFQVELAEAPRRGPDLRGRDVVGPGPVLVCRALIHRVPL